MIASLDAVRGGRGYLPEAQVRHAPSAAERLPARRHDARRDPARDGARWFSSVTTSRERPAPATTITTPGFPASTALVATAWAGLDQEACSAPVRRVRTAVPIWVLHAPALRGMPQSPVPAPEGLVTVKISRDGLLASADDPSAIFETFIEGRLPEAGDPFARGAQTGPDRTEESDEPLF
jgi:hypothetical protein